MMSAEEKQSLAASMQWFHSIDLGDGVVTAGMKPAEALRVEADLAFRYGVEGHSVIDFGAADGFFSFEAKRRGAARVLATDRWDQGATIRPDVPATWNRKKRFESAKACLGLEIEELQADVSEITANTVGTFDTVLFLGVLYHLKDPLGAIETVARMARKTLVVETAIDAGDVDRPAMIFYPGSELNNDPNNWWGPNAACLVGMMKVAGFETVVVDRGSCFPGRAWVYGLR